MIVKPTVNELLNHAENRFALVIATSRRARQIADNKDKLSKMSDISPVTIAANEIADDKIKIIENIDKTQELNEENLETKKENEE